MRTWSNVTYKDAKLRFCCSRADVVELEFVRLRESLEAYILRSPGFRTSLVPVKLLPDAPPIARAMHEASLLTGVGPMAAVAGAVAEAVARRALEEGASEALIENGGDMFLASNEPVTVGIYTGTSKLSGRIAFAVPADMLPLSVCASSGRMGHSLSFGDCDLSVVVSKSGALADAAATLAGNLVRVPSDIDAALERLIAVPGILGLLLVKDDAVGKAGNLPPLVRAEAADTQGKVTRF